MRGRCDWFTRMNVYPFKNRLDTGGAVTIHHRNLSPRPIHELFEEQHKHDLRNKMHWQVPKINTVSYGMESLRYRGPLTWEIAPGNIKESTSLDIFNRKIKAWKPQGLNM